MIRSLHALSVPPDRGHRCQRADAARSRRHPTAPGPRRDRGDAAHRPGRAPLRSARAGTCCGRPGPHCCPKTWRQQPGSRTPGRHRSGEQTGQPAKPRSGSAASGAIPWGVVRWSAPGNATTDERIPVRCLNAYLWPRRSTVTWGKGGPHSGSRHLADRDEGGGSSPGRPTTGNAQPKRWSSYPKPGGLAGYRSRTLTWLPFLVKGPFGDTQRTSDRDRAGLPPRACQGRQAGSAGRRRQKSSGSCPSTACEDGSGTRTDRPRRWGVNCAQPAVVSPVREASYFSAVAQGPKDPCGSLSADHPAA